MNPYTNFHINTSGVELSIHVNFRTQKEKKDLHDDPILGGTESHEKQVCYMRRCNVQVILLNITPYESMNELQTIIKIYMKLITFQSF